MEALFLEVKDMEEKVKMTINELVNQFHYKPLPRSLSLTQR